MRHVDTTTVFSHPGMSAVIGPLPQIAPKKHFVPSVCKVERGAAEDRSGNGALCPRVSLLGDVIDIGESACRFTADARISRLRE